ncbi:MAG TPA: hypothetical protein VEF04_01880 [Blastocatellia bacterium]|nr:hypothetical protein [Blastocatellia bacterium]
MARERAYYILYHWSQYDRKNPDREFQYRYGYSVHKTRHDMDTPKGLSAVIDELETKTELDIFPVSWRELKTQRRNFFRELLSIFYRH